MSRDPIGERGGGNRYAVVGNEPIRFYDALGLTAEDGVPSVPPVVISPPIPGLPGYTPPPDPLADELAQFNAWYAAQTDLSWISQLSDRKCPCKLKQTCRMRPDYSTPGEIRSKAYFDWVLPDEVDAAKWSSVSDPISPFVERFHPGARMELRSKATANGHTNQCTYDDNGELITEPPAMGTVDRRQGGHWPDDVDPVMWAAMLDGQWDGDGGPMLFGRIKDGASGSHLTEYYAKRPCYHDNCPANGVD